ncbi:MAG: DUF4405 domain-containing protein [Thermodesulfobacteriota bacterium]
MTVKNAKVNFWVNTGLLLFGVVMVFSGLLLQLVYHLGHHGGIDANQLALGMNYFHWSDVHKVSIVFVSIGMVFHIILHRKWYTTVFKKKKTVLKNQQVVLLTIIFLSVAISGYIPWIIKLSGGSELSRKDFIEIHDKITWVWLGYLVFHVCQRFKWFLSAIKKRSLCL